jgi:hypothetical protein
MRFVLAAALALLTAPAFAAPASADAPEFYFVTNREKCRLSEIAHELGGGPGSRQPVCLFQTDFSFRGATHFRGDQICTLTQPIIALEREAARAFPGQAVAMIKDGMMTCAESVAMRR